MTKIVIPKPEVVDIDLLKVDGNNPNRMTEAQKEALRESMKKYGFIDPIITNIDYLIADGQTRWEIAKELGLKQVSVIRLPISEVDRRILRQVLNKLRGEHDKQLDFQEYKFLLQENSLDELKKFLGESEVSLVQFLARESVGENKEQDFNVGESLAKPKYEIRLGDKWKLGRHTLICGDATNHLDYALLLGNEKVDMVFTDPPYGVSFGSEPNAYVGGNRGIGREAARVKAWGVLENDSLEGEEYTNFLEKSLRNVKDSMGENYCAYICASWKTLENYLEALKRTGLELDKGSLIVWNKGSIGIGYRNKPTYELIFYSRAESTHWYGGLAESDVWDISRDATTAYEHPTQKPLEVVNRALINSCPIEGKVLDPFGGSGSTLIACEQANRTCFMMEIDPKYCSVIIERFEKLTGLKAEKVSE